MSLFYSKLKIIFGILALLFIIISCTESTDNSIDSQRPNILLINIDDLGWKDLGFMGSNYYETPNIDQLATRGMVFSRAYASAANCAPSRASLFSGQYSPRTGVYTVNNSDRGKSIHRKLIPTPNTEHLADSVQTIAEVLNQDGYQTVHVGKWHLGESPKTQGFDVNIAGTDAGNPRANGMGGYFAPYDNPHLEEGPEGEYLNDRITTEAIAFLKEKKQPFFMNYSPYIVHTPIQPKQELKEKYDKKGGTPGNSNSGYAAMVETMDQNVGRVLDHLEETGQLENTFIIFTSDNGGLFRVSEQDPLRAGKGAYYEGGIRVPLIIVWPGHGKGVMSDQPVSNIDFFPTMLEVAGIEKPESKILDGISLLPALKEEELEERYIYWHFPIYLQAYQGGENPDLPDPYFRTRPGSVIMKGSWKLHEYFEDGRIELYNLETDIGEHKNVKGLYPERAKEMHRQLKEWRQQTNAPVPVQPNPKYTGEQS